MVKPLLGDGFTALTPHLLITSPSAWNSLQRRIAS